MKKYLWTSALFLFNNEVVSAIALTIIAWMALIALLKEMDRGGFFK